MQPSENIDHGVPIGKDGLNSLAKTTPYWITGARWATLVDLLLRRKLDDIL
jgi:hypothetical protein